MKIDKNFISMIFGFNGGEYATELYRRAKEIHDSSNCEVLKMFILEQNELLSRDEYKYLWENLDYNNTRYVEDGYKLGFNDGVKFFASLLMD